MVITAHFHTYRARRRRVKESAAAHVGGETGDPQRLDPSFRGRRDLSPPRGGKVNGRAGTCMPIRSDERIERRRALLLKCGEGARARRSRFGEILFKKKKERERRALERRAVDFEINQESSGMKCHRGKTAAAAAPVWKREASSKRGKKDCEKKHLRYLGGALRYSGEMKRRRAGGGGGGALARASNGNHIGNHGGSGGGGGGEGAASGLNPRIVSSS